MTLEKKARKIKFNLLEIFNTSKIDNKQINRQQTVLIENCFK